MPDSGVRDRLSMLFEMRMEKLSQQLVDGELSLSDWQRSMKQELRDLHGLQLVSGAGGNQSDVAPEDWYKVNIELQRQYEYLAKFAQDIKDGDIEGAALVNRAGLYAGSGKITYWKQATNNLDLPTMPGEQQCRGNCGCEWVIEYETDDEGNEVAANCYWRRGKSDSCDDCIRNEEQYNPYHIDLVAEAA